MSYGRIIGDSPIVARGVVVQIGTVRGMLDAHVRSNMLVLRCETVGDQPWEMSFNDEDAAILLQAAMVAARQLPIEKLAESLPYFHDGSDED